MDGILNINKPSGPTSFDIVSKIKKFSKERRVGHAGTLDPLATGVLPICLGQGTRIVEFLVTTSKTYQAEIELGIATDTYDSAGKITRTGAITRIDRDKIDSVLSTFRGSIQQIPPPYSALKRHGKPLYVLARAGITLELESRPVTIHNLEIRNWQSPVITIEVTCSKGTYIRSLAHDIGQALDCGAHLKNLIRLNYGIFSIKDAVSPTQLEDAFNSGYWKQLVYPIDSVLSHWRAIVVSDETVRDIKNGRFLVLENDIRNQDSYDLEQSALNGSLPEIYCRAYAHDGSFLGILLYNPEKGQWHPRKVFC